MSSLTLVLATPENNLMQHVIAEWDRQITAQKMPKSALDAVRTYEAQLKPDRTYGVYILCQLDAHGIGKPPFEAFFHINHAFPKTPKPTLRLTWSRLAPRYEWEENLEENHARIFTELISNALTLSLQDLKSSEIKIYLFSNADRVHGRKFASQISDTEKLTSTELPFTVRVRGNWLHLNWKNGTLP